MVGPSLCIYNITISFLLTHFFFLGTEEKPTFHKYDWGIVAVTFFDTPRPDLKEPKAEPYSIAERTAKRLKTTEEQNAVIDALSSIVKTVCKENNESYTRLLDATKDCVWSSRMPKPKRLSSPRKNRLVDDGGANDSKDKKVGVGGAGTGDGGIVVARKSKKQSTIRSFFSARI